jgi:dolichol-phosphate mannosyltransferase
LQKLSIIVPVYNEEPSINSVVSRISAAVEPTKLDWEILFVDNCSSDGTKIEIIKHAKRDKRVKYIRFSRNFGPSVEASIDAGYKHASGDAAMVIYSDLQDPPELIENFVEKWQSGFDVVYGVQKSRDGEKLWRRIAVKIFYRVFKSISDSPTMTDSGDFKLISRRVLDLLVLMPEKARFTRGLVSWLGFPSIGVEYVRQPRDTGSSKASFLAITRTAITAVTSFSLKPLRILSGFGLVVTLLSLLFMFALIIGALVGNPQPGITTLACISLLSLGLNMGALGLIGEYLGRIQQEVKNRPLFVIEEKINL